MKYWIGLLCIAALLLVASSAPASAETKKAPLAVTDIVISPEVMMPGDRGTITVTFASTMSPNGADVTKAVVEKVVMEPYGPISVQPGWFETSVTLGEGDTARYTFEIYVDSGASDGVYYPKLTAYTKEGGASLVYQVPVRVDSSPARIILSQSPDLSAAEGGNVVLDVANVRPGDIDCVSIEPIGDEFLFEPVQEYYIGSIGPGESYTVEFGVKNREESFNSTPAFKLKYKNGDNWHETSPLLVKVTMPLAGAGVETTSPALAMLVIMISAVTVICGGVFVIMRRKRAPK